MAFLFRSRGDKRSPKVAIVLTVCAVLASCYSAPKLQPRLVPFDESEYEKYAGSGTSSITGQAFGKTRGGDVKYAAGEVVTLTPATSYSTEWYQRAVLSHFALVSADPRQKKYQRTTMADGEGRFRFDNLVAGHYYVTCPVYWEIPNPNYRNEWSPLFGENELTYTGGVAYAEVFLEEGDSMAIVVVP